MNSVHVSFRQLFSTLFILFVGLLAATALQAATTWTGPTAAPPGGNVAAPINVGTIDQVKNAGLSLNSLAVFGSQYVQSKLGVGVVSPVVSIETPGTIKIGNGGEVCQAVTEGGVRYNSASKKLEFCDGTAWAPVGSSTAGGTQVYSTPGTYSFTVPVYGSGLSVTVRGAGGGAGDGAYTGPSGSSGGSSSFGSVVAGGGSGGVSAYNQSGAGGSGGVATGGASNVNGAPGEHSQYTGNGLNGSNLYGIGGSAPGGGSGGFGGYLDSSGNCISAGLDGNAIGGGGGAGCGGSGAGGGGSGALATKFYPAGALVPGTTVSVVVGAGGPGGASSADALYSGTTRGGAGARGDVQITWW